MSTFADFQEDNSDAYEPPVLDPAGPPPPVTQVLPVFGGATVPAIEASDTSLFGDTTANPLAFRTSGAPVIGGAVHPTSPTASSALVASVVPPGQAGLAPAAQLALSFNVDTTAQATPQLSDGVANDSDKMVAAAMFKSKQRRQEDDDISKKLTKVTQVMGAVFVLGGLIGFIVTRDSCRMACGGGQPNSRCDLCICRDGEFNGPLGRCDYSRLTTCSGNGAVDRTGNCTCDDNILANGQVGDPFTLPGCHNPQVQTQEVTATSLWSLESDRNELQGIYEIKETQPTLWPGARFGAVQWVSTTGDAWLFGGMGCDHHANGICGDIHYNNPLWYGNGIGTDDPKIGTSATYLNDMWRYHDGIWTSFGGGELQFTSRQTSGGIVEATPANSSGSAGWNSAEADAMNGYDRNSISALNLWPGKRALGAVWVLFGDVYLFGGQVCTNCDKNQEHHAGNIEYLNDMWSCTLPESISPQLNWTRMAPSDPEDIAHGDFPFVGLGGRGVYGPSPSWPGGRSGMAAWVTTVGNDETIYLFGGRGYSENDFTGGRNVEYTNDLWSCAPNQLQWGVHATFHTNDVPSPRSLFTVWPGGNTGHTYLFGGFGEDGAYGDLWKFTADGDTVSFAPVSSVTATQADDDPPDYSCAEDVGGLPCSNSVVHPGSRYMPTGWRSVDGDGKTILLWLFGGRGIVSEGTDCDADTQHQCGFLGDLWSYSVVHDQWTWQAGHNDIDQGGIYQALPHVPDPINPGGRMGAMAWVDQLGKGKLFGGLGKWHLNVAPGEKTGGVLADLWELEL